MLLSRARDRPWSALTWWDSSARATLATPSSTEIEIRSGNRRLISPLGPLTVTDWPATATSTPDGNVMGAFPIRLISPNLAHDLTAEAAATGFPVGQETLGGRHDDHAETTLHPRQVRGALVDAMAGLRHAAQSLDDGTVPIDVAEPEGQGVAGPGGSDVVAVDVSLFGQDPGHLFLQFGGRHGDVVVAHGH